MYNEIFKIVAIIPTGQKAYGIIKLELNRGGRGLGVVDC
jgi:hypothetical protein